MSIKHAIEAMGKATPGPWFVMPEGFGDRTRSPTVYATDDELRYVAKCDDYANIVPTDNLANATLIAAAPDMAAWIQRALPHLKEWRECIIWTIPEYDREVVGLDVLIKEATDDHV